jgi:nitrogen fixation protein FixH
MTGMAGKTVTGRQVFFWIAAFFGVVFVVNAIMTVLALSTFNGVTKDDAYVDGLAYNETLAAVDAQRQRGWVVETDIHKPGGRQIILRATFEDSNGSPIDSLSVSAEFVRPVVEGIDFIVPFEARGAGAYQVDAKVPLPGQWDIRIVAEQSGRPPYILKQRSVIR